MVKTTIKGASTHALGIKDKVWATGAHHWETCVKTLRDLLANWVTSLMTWLVIGIALALPAILYLLLANAGSLGGGFDGSARINLYLAKNQNLPSLLAEIRAYPEIENAELIHANDALKSFEAETGFGNILLSLPNNPLPDVIEAQPESLSPAELTMLVTQLEAVAGVERAAVDLEWIERLFAILALGERFVTTLGLFLSLGVVLAIGNTIRLAIENRRAEIEIIKLVGATDAFVRRPFLYLGFWYGFGGALIAWVMVQLSLLVLSGPIEELLDSYQNQFSLAGLGPATTFSLFAVGIGLGVGGASIAVSRHLHTIEPS
ncbi:MAG: cell division transport system permease protein [Planctomycetaceae bacterium]|jgi:cell division transport system permease protein